MKKSKVFFAIALVMAISFVQTSCIGSFKLSGKVLKWNKGLGNKFINELVFLLLVVVQVYSITMLIDGLILNTIEFWTGSNPMAMNAGEYETKVVEQNGVKYQVTASQNRFDFIQLEGAQKGQTGALVYNPDTQTWSYEGQNQSIRLLKLNADGTATAYLPNGQSKTVDGSGNGLASLKAFARSVHYYAER
jgi:hypothetical protein